MPVLPFEELLPHYPPPYRELVYLMSQQFHGEIFSSFIIDGNYDGAENLSISAWLILGIVPPVRHMLSCNHMDHYEASELEWKRRFSKLLPVLTRGEEFAETSPDFWAGAMQEALGPGKPHVLGMITLNKTVITGRDVAVLWVHRKVARSLMEYLFRNEIKCKFDNLHKDPGS